MVVLLGKQEHLSAVRLEEIAAVVKPRGIPIMVDAASEHIERPSPWLVRGADLVIYSGGKFLRGPQTSGLLLGNKRLVEAAWRNGSPHQALGRPMKVSKEDIVGVIAALEVWFEARDPAAERQKWYDDCAVIAELLSRIAGVRGEVIEPEGVDRVPRLNIVWDRDRYRLDGMGLREAVLDGEPRVMLDDNSAAENSIAVDPFQLQPGEAAQVGDALVRALRASLTNRTPDAPLPAAAVAGEWELRVDFLQGARDHRLVLHQRGSDLAGEQHSAQFRGAGRGPARRRPGPLHFRRPLRGEQFILPLRRPGRGRRDVRHRRARRRQRPERRPRQQEPVRHRPMAGPPGGVRRFISCLSG